MSQSLIAAGQEFQFPLDVIKSDVNFDTPLFSKIKYAKDLTHRISKCHEVYKVLIDEHHIMHQEYVNARRPDPFLFEKGNFVWVRRQIKSNENKGVVGKLCFQHTGP